MEETGTTHNCLSTLKHLWATLSLAHAHRNTHAHTHTYTHTHTHTHTRTNTGKPSERVRRRQWNIEFPHAVNNVSSVWRYEKEVGCCLSNVDGKLKSIRVTGMTETLTLRLIKNVSRWYRKTTLGARISTTSPHLHFSIHPLCCLSCAVKVQQQSLWLGGASCDKASRLKTVGVCVLTHTMMVFYFC